MIGKDFIVHSANFGSFSVPLAPSTVHNLVARSLLFKCLTLTVSGIHLLRHPTHTQLTLTDCSRAGEGPCDSCDYCTQLRKFSCSKKKTVHTAETVYRKNFVVLKPWFFQTAVYLETSYRPMSNVYDFILSDEYNQSYIKKCFFALYFLY